MRYSKPILLILKNIVDKMKKKSFRAIVFETKELKEKCL